MARIITVASGKGGVGKTNISVNLALLLASRGYRVCLFDADLGLANVNILLNLFPEHNLGDVILHGKRLKDIIIRDYHGIDIIPGSSGIEKMTDLDTDQLGWLIEEFAMTDAYDFIIFDTSAGISKNVISFCMASPEVILIISPEPTSLTDGFALLKILAMNGFNRSAMVAVNQCRNTEIGAVAFRTLSNTVRKYLKLTLLPIGIVLKDNYVTESVQRQQPFVQLYPGAKASKCLQQIADRLIKRETTDFETTDVEKFWVKYLTLFSSSLKLHKKKTPKKEALKTTAAHAHLQKKDTTQHPSAIKTAAAAQPPQTTDADKKKSSAPAPDNADHAVIDRLVDSVSALTEEVKAIRKALEARNEQRPPVKHPSSEEPPILIPLDFQKFLKNRKREQ